MRKQSDTKPSSKSLGTIPQGKMPSRLVFFVSSALVFLTVIAGCTSGDLSSSSTGSQTPSSTTTSVPISQTGGNTVSSPQANTNGLVFALSQQPNICARVDKIEVGGRLILGTCDGDASTLFDWANGQLRSHKTLCLGAPSLPATATSLDATTPLALMTCDASNSTQRFDFQPGTSMGPTLGGTRYRLVGAPGFALGSLVQTEPSSTKINLLEFTIAAAANNAKGVAGTFAMTLGTSDLCLGLNSAGAPSAQPCSSASNLWQASISGRITDLKNNCLSFDANGDMTLALCDSTSPQQIATYNGQLWAQVNNMCVSFGTPPTANTSHITYVGCDTNLGTQIAWQPL